MARRDTHLSIQLLESRRLTASVLMPSVSWSGDSSSPYRNTTITEQVSAPIQVTGAENLRAAEVRIQFDPQKVTTDVSRIHGGKLWDGRAAVIANVDQESGTIVAFLYSANPVKEGDGDLLDIHFVAKSDTSSGEPIEIDVQEVRLNEGQILLVNEPKVGPDASDGRIETAGMAEENCQIPWAYDPWAQDYWANDHWARDHWAREQSSFSHIEDSGFRPKPISYGPMLPQVVDLLLQTSPSHDSV